VAWLLGWAGLYLASPSGAGLFPVWVAGLGIAALFAGAIVVSTVHGVRAGRGIAGRSKEAGALYGWSWTLAFAALTAVNVGVTQLGVSSEVTTLLWSGSTLVLAGGCSMAGAAMCRDRLQYGTGAWMLISGALSVFVGTPGNFLVLSLAGGGGYLVAAGLFALRGTRRAEVTV
jgi:hypothetical protein